MSSSLDTNHIGIVGAGAMGRGIAQVSAVAGLQVVLFDTLPETLADAKESIGAALDRQVDRKRMSSDEAAAAVGRIALAGQIENLRTAGVVVEAIVEDLAAKQALFSRLEGVVADAAVLASNTSSLSITAIASACRRRERVAGLHFFNPVPAMRLVEVVPTPDTSDDVVRTLFSLAERIGKHPVRASDTPGFLVNHIGRGYGPEALRILSEQIATPADIDAIMRACGFRMGPLELFDLTGMDVSLPVMEQIYRDYYEDPLYRPSLLARRQLAAGYLGRKTSRGFYAYEGGNKIVPRTAERLEPRSAPIWPDRNGPVTDALIDRLRAAGATIETGERASPDATCLVAPLGLDATSTAVTLRLDARRTVAVDVLLDASNPTAVMRTPLTETTRAAWLADILGAPDAPLPIINDSPGFVAQRVIAMIVNIACNVAQQRIAAPADIDLGVKLGLAYPKGPLEWGDEIGASRVLAILDALHTIYRDPRYRASVWLRRRAMLGVSLLTADEPGVEPSAP